MASGSYCERIRVGITHTSAGGRIIPLSSSPRAPRLFPRSYKGNIPRPALHRNSGMQVRVLLADSDYFRKDFHHEYRERNHKIA